MGAIGALIVAAVMVIVAAAHEHHHEGGGFTCNHDSIEVQRAHYIHGFDESAPQTYGSNSDASSSRKFEATSTTSNIRIVLSTAALDDSAHYCDTATGTSSNFNGGTEACSDANIFNATKKDVLLNNVLPAAMQVLQAALMVAPVSGNLVVPSASCAFAVKGANDATTGVANADFVLYVSAGPTATGVLAFAVSCAYDQNNRPIAGIANFGPAYLTWSATDAEANAQTVATATHEILHALGFSYTFATSRFVNKTSAEVVKQVTIRGKSANMVITPEVVSRSRTYFSCTTLEGAELEDEGGAGSALSHWDRRIYPNELMAANGGTTLSEITLAFLKDSGHYDVDYTKSSAMSFGKSAGCGFVYDKCNTQSGGSGRWWCFDTVNSNQYCTSDYKSVGYCGVQTFGSSLPSYFQYFSNPAQGGYQFLDYCPRVLGFSNRACETAATPTSSESLLGFYFGTSGRCFSTSDVKATGVTSSTVQTGRCFEARCPSGTRIEVRVGGTNTEWVACPTDGFAGTVSVPASWGTGTINCPPASDFCDAAISTGVTPTTPAPPPPFVPPVGTGTAVALTPSPPTPVPVTTADSASSNGTTAPPVVITNTPAPVATPIPAVLTPAPPTPVPTPVPLSTTPTSDPQTFQLASTLAFASFSTAARAEIQSAVAAALGISASGVSVTQVIVGEGTMLGFTVVRVDVVSDQTEAQIFATLSASVAQSTSVLGSTYGVTSSAVQAVVDCGTLCDATGTLSSFRNSENTACVCTCRNQFEGTSCDTCPTQFSGTLCDACASGKIGYPSCVTDPGCQSPSTPRYTPGLDIRCSIYVDQHMRVHRATCNAIQCSCLLGTLDTTTQVCTTSTTPSSCQRLQCMGENRECLYQTQLGLMQETSDCSADITNFIAGGASQREWCAFDSCIDSRISCSDATINATACSRSTKVFYSASAQVSTFAARAVLLLAMAVAFIAA